MLSVTLLAVLAGCAQTPQPLYDWGDYPRQVYEHLKGAEEGPEAQLRQLQEQAQKAEGSGLALPPGFRAHMGKLYLQLGRFDEARAHFEAEKTAFPEATPYIDFLLRNMGAQQPTERASRTPS